MMGEIIKSRQFIRTSLAILSQRWMQNKETKNFWLRYHKNCRRYPPEPGFFNNYGMLLLWIFSLVCAASCSDRYSTPELPPDGIPDALLMLLEDTYKTDRGKTGWGKSGHAGEPLLLTPLIEQNKLQEARDAAKVDSRHILPGLNSYAGYLTVNKEYDANLWFWYFPVAQKVEETPWIIWLDGGPGVPSSFSLFNQIGPIMFTRNKTVEEMKYSWGKNHSLLFIDNPVGTGFSFTSDPRGYATSQATIGENLYSALQQFLTMFPELRKAPLTIAGYSYAGKHIPSIGIQILHNREKDRNQPINLQGLAIGNGFIDPRSLMRYSFFLREIGLVDDNVADSIRELELKVMKYIDQGDMVQAFYAMNKVLDIIISKSDRSLYNFLRPNMATSVSTRFLKLLKRSTVRRALHVGDTAFSIVGLVYSKLRPDIMNSTKMWLEELLDNYRVMLYSGHLDIIVAYHPSVNTYNSLVFTGSQDYKNATRNPWYHRNKLAGYYKTAGNLMEVMVLGSGHAVPFDKPAQALGLITAFTRELPLHDTGRLVDVE